MSPLRSALILLLHSSHLSTRLSISVPPVTSGQSAIFLIGGPTKEVEPLPIFLHSGDILIMSGEARKCFHAVPKIMKERKSIAATKQSKILPFDTKVCLAR